MRSSKNTHTFASLLKRNTPVKHWKGGRVVDYSGLENRRAERHRGFESLPFRRERATKVARFSFLCINDFGIYFYTYLSISFICFSELLRRYSHSLRNIKVNFIFRSFIRIFEINLQDTCARCEKYSSKLDISRSLIRIFINKL